MIEITAKKAAELAERFPKCETTRNALQRAKRMRDPVFVQFDGAVAEVDVAERRDMGLVEQAINAVDQQIATLTDRREELEAMIVERQRDIADYEREMGEINAFLQKYGEPQPAPKKRGRPEGSKVGASRDREVQAR